METKNSLLVAEFMLLLYNERQLVQPEWAVQKQRFHEEIQKFAQTLMEPQALFQEAGFPKLKDLLVKSSFLLKESDKKYYFNGDAVMDIVSEKITIFEEASKKGIITNEKDTGKSQPNIGDPPKPIGEASNLAADKIACKFRGSLTMQRKNDFVGDEMSCDICQIHFATMDDYEQHVEVHSDQGNLEFARKLEPLNLPMLSITMRRNDNGKGLFFTLATQRTDLMLERVFVVLPYTMLNLLDDDKPKQLQRETKLYLDTSVLLEFQMYPIVVVASAQATAHLLLIEQHCFMLTSVVPRRNKDQENLVMEELDSYVPPVTLRKIGAADREEFGDQQVMSLSKEMHNYIAHDHTLSVENISGVLRTLLHLEDSSVLKNYLRCVQHNAKIQRVWNDMDVGYVYSLNMYVEGVRNSTFHMVQAVDRILILPESEATRNMPMLAQMDLLLKKDFRPQEVWGIVKNVSYKTITFVLNAHIPTDGKYMVVFQPSRKPICLQHRSLAVFDRASDAEKSHYLFPSYRGPLRDRSSKDFPKIGPLVNEKIRDDAYQYRAVARIVRGPKFEAPYIILGPPGSGKTTTLVEAIVQLYLHNPEARILVTTSTNFAADDVALRLLHVLLERDPNSGTHAQMLRRIYARSRRHQPIDDLLRQYSNLREQHRFPTLAELGGYRIIVSTLATVALLTSGGFGFSAACRYSHVFIDEVQSATLTEALSAVCVAMAAKAALIISGDHKQLPPIVYSQLATKYGMQMSLMEFLFKNDCYRVDEAGNYDLDVQVRLRNNYRSHPAIVNLIGKLSYNGELVAIPPDEAYAFNSYSTNAEFPIMFDAQFGVARHGKRSLRTSLYNTDEIDIVLDYVGSLLCFGVQGKAVGLEDIGIISPYKAQHLRIREELNLRSWQKIETGSVEMFQGREKKIIIVSFVRSFGANGLGFLKDPRRLNVILSRPQSLLILIGNPQVLRKNPDIQHILEECSKHGTLINFTLKDPQPHPVAAPKKKRPKRKKSAAKASADVKKLETDLAKLKVEEKPVKQLANGLIKINK